MNSSEINFTRRFHGLARLYGGNNFNLLKQSHVAVIGLGGVGSWTAEALARSGIGNITLVDLDNISESNINRQIHALTSSIGKPKVFTMKERILEINPLCNVICKEDFISTDNIQYILCSNYDVIIDCIDQVSAKLALISFAASNGISLFVCGSAGGKTNFLSLRNGDIYSSTYDRLLSSLRTKIRKNHDLLNVLRKRTKHRKKNNVIGVNALWFEQQTVYPDNCSKSNMHNGLSCAGYGSVVTLTAAMGFAAANLAINDIIESLTK